MERFHLQFTNMNQNHEVDCANHEVMVLPHMVPFVFVLLTSQEVVLRILFATHIY